jgi:hypothetical protein
MLSFVVKLLGSGTLVVLVCLAAAGRADATAFRARAAGHTRITLFLAGVALVPGDQPFVTVQAEDQQQHVFDLPVEGTARVRNLSWISQVTVRLPDALSGVGNVTITVTVRGKASNKAPIQIQ